MGAAYLIKPFGYFWLFLLTGPCGNCIRNCIVVLCYTKTFAIQPIPVYFVSEYSVQHNFL